MKYEAPSVNIIYSENDDVITASGGLVYGDDSNHGESF